MTMASGKSVALSCAWLALSSCGTSQSDDAEDSNGSGQAGHATSVAGQNASGNGTGAAGGGGRSNDAGGSSIAGRAAGGRAQAGSAGASGAAGLPAAGSGSAGAPGECSSIRTFEHDKTPTRELHVATTGSDSAGDGSESEPFATLERAAEEAAPGTAIRIHSGTYPGDSYIEGLVGTEAEPIWLGGAPGESPPIIAGGAQAIHLARASWVVLHDLEVRGQTANGINADDGGEVENAEAAQFLIFRNLHIHDVGSGGNQDCLKLSGIRSYFVLDSEFARCGGGSSGSAIDHVGCHDGVIARNDFSDLSGGNAVQCKGGSRNIEVLGNRIRNGGQRAVNMGGSTGFEFFRPPLSTSAENSEATNIRVISNLIEGGIAALGFVGCVDCLAANNTIIDPDNWVLRILQETTTTGEHSFAPARNGRFVNNLVYFSRSALSTTVNVGPNTQAATFAFQNNLWFAHDDPSRSRPTDLPSAEQAGIYGEDPELAADFAIPSSSPARAAGRPLPEISRDFRGRCYADTPSIGAFEAP